MALTRRSRSPTRDGGIEREHRRNRQGGRGAQGLADLLEGPATPDLQGGKVRHHDGNAAINAVVRLFVPHNLINASDELNLELRKAGRTLRVLERSTFLMVLSS